VQIANTTLQSQVPSTEDQAEKKEMKALLQQLSANMTLVNDTLSKKLQFLVEDESKNKVSLLITLVWLSSKVWKLVPLYSFFVSTWELSETWSVLTCWYLTV